jgi:hypothetical protein
MTNEEIVEQIVLLLLKITPDPNNPFSEYEVVASEAADMAFRINKAKTDPTWLTIPGSPDYNKRLAKIAKEFAK